MILVKIYGGLGNQLFQYAMARNLAARNSTSVKLDLSWFSDCSGATSRKFMLDAFNVKYELATAKEVNSCRLLRKVLGKQFYEYFCPFSMKSYFRLLEFQDFDQRYSTLKIGSRNIYLDGYWTDERFFLENAEIIRSEYSLRNSLSHKSRQYSNMIEGTESVSLHVRRGDYVNNPQNARIFDICRVEYYMAAMAEMCKTVKQPTFFVFSDDIDWAKNNIKTDYDVKFISDIDSALPYEEMILMSKCKHNIIANSTFSWWGAWLNDNKSKIVIAPRKWFNLQNSSGVSIVPSGWLTLDV